MRESDFKYILSVLQGEDTKSKPTDWYSILGFLEFHRVAVYFYNRALELGIDLPEQIVKKLYESYDEQKMVCQKKSKYIELISSALEKSHVNYAFLKGSVLQDRNFQQLSNEYFSSRRYPQHYKIYKQGERNSNDIDILVSQKNLFKIGEVLRGLGFQQGRYDYKSGKFIAFSRQEILTRRMNRGETAPYVLVTGDPLLPFVEVDLNFSLDNLPGGKEVDYFLQDTIILDGIRTLEQSKFFLHLLTHQDKEISLFDMWCRNKNQSLYKFLDIYLFLWNGLVSYSELYNYCKDEKIRQICCRTITDTMSIFVSLNRRRGIIDLLKDIDKPSVNTKIIDYSSRKIFVATEEIGKRYLHFEQKKFLKEVNKND